MLKFFDVSSFGSICCRYSCHLLIHSGITYSKLEFSVPCHLYYKWLLRQYSDCATGWTTVVLFPVGAIMGFFLFATAVSGPVLKPTQPPIQRVPEFHSPGGWWGKTAGA